MTFNSDEALKTFWSDYRPDDFDWIVVDNASTDDSIEVARSLGARVIPLVRNVGFSAANNVGAAICGHDVLVFANPDVHVTSDGLDKLVQRVAERGGIVAPQLTNVDGTPQENGRGLPYPFRKFSHMLQPSSLSNQRYVRVAQAGELLEVTWVMGAVVAMRQSDFQSLGGWDSGFFVYYEDSDLGMRAALAGMPVFVDGSVRWRHGWARETAGKFHLKPWIFEMRSALRFYTKHPYCVFPIGKKGRALVAIDRRTFAGTTSSGRRAS